MIRRIKSTEDIAQAVELLKLFMEETAYQHCYPSYDNQEHLGRLVHQIV